VVSGFGRTAFALERFRGRGLRHSPEGDAWREYGGNTARLPDANLWVAWEMGRPTHHRSWVLQIRRLAARTRWRMNKDGGAEYLDFNTARRRGGNFGFEGFMGLYRQGKRKFNV